MVVMGRLAFNILLVTNLLVCPLRCFSCETEVAVGKDYGQSACCCCPVVPEGDESSNDNPSPGDDCSCPNCICEGATIQSAPEIPATDPFVAFGAWIVPVDEFRQEGTSSQRTEPKNRPPRFPGGRDALVAHQAWLI